MVSLVSITLPDNYACRCFSTSNPVQHDSRRNASRHRHWDENVLQNPLAHFPLISYLNLQHPSLKVRKESQAHIPNPGNNPPSNAPNKIRQATNPLNPCVIPVKVATIPHPVVMKDSHRDGVNFLITRLDGSSEAMYVTNNSETAIWNWSSPRPRSSSMP